ncbi:MAG: hypothetical protein GYB36_11190 [Alphaproteobacteria bacterium]|nr:hypothetical protein [Alphaproteobacteria bacterium]
MLDTQHWKIGLGLLGGLSDAQVAFLLDFAEINARRVEHVFRAWALIMVTVPVGTLVGANELFPDLFGQSLVSFYGALIIIISAWASVAGIMFMSSWRAKDLEDLLRFEMARRTHADAQDTGQDA